MEFKELVLDIFQRLQTLYRKKNEQYGMDHDDLPNFRDGAFLNGDDPEDKDACFKALKGYMNKHISKVERSTELNEQVAESLGDIAVYCIIAMAMQEYEARKYDKDF